MFIVLIKAEEVKVSIEINHILVRTSDLKYMSRFLTHIAGLEEGFRPAFDFSGAWLYTGDKPLIHLVEIDSYDASLSGYLGNKTSQLDIGIGAVDHIALTGTDYMELLNRLKQQQFKYYERTVPSTNEHQVFVEGPDCLKLELLFNVDKSSINTCI